MERKMKNFYLIFALLFLCAFVPVLLNYYKKIETRKKDFLRVSSLVYASEYFPKSVYSHGLEYIFMNQSGDERIFRNSFGLTEDMSSESTMHQILKSEDISLQIIVNAEKRSHRCQENLLAHLVHFEESTREDEKISAKAEGGIHSEFLVDMPSRDNKLKLLKENWDNAEHYDGRTVNGIHLHDIYCGTGKIFPKGTTSASSYEICLQKKQGFVYYKYEGEMWVLKKIES